MVIITAGPGRDNQTAERFIIVVNYADFDQFVDIPFSANGAWDDLLNEQSVVVSGFRLLNQRINSNWGRFTTGRGELACAG